MRFTLAPKNKAMSLMLLSIVLPVSLLAAFRIAGIVPEPQTPETTTVEAVTWSMNRPSSNIVVMESVSNSHAESDTSIDLDVNVVKYFENDPDYPAWGDDFLKLRIVALVDVSNGFVSSIVVRFFVDPLSYVTMERHSDSMEFHNLEITKFLGRYSSSFEARATNKPQNSSLSILVYFVLSDKNSIDHWATMTLEVVYFAAGTNRKVEVPLQLGVLI